MMMFHCSDKSQTFQLATRNFKHSSSTPKLVVVFIFPVVVGFLVLLFCKREGVKSKGGWGGVQSFNILFKNLMIVMNNDT